MYIYKDPSPWRCRYNLEPHRSDLYAKLERKYSHNVYCLYWSYEIWSHTQI